MMDHLAGKNPKCWQITFSTRDELHVAEGLGSMVMIPSHPRSSFGKSGSLLSLRFLISNIKIINSALEWTLHNVLCYTLV